LAPNFQGPFYHYKNTELKKESISIFFEKHEGGSLSLKDNFFFVNKWTRVVFAYFWIPRRDLNACCIKSSVE
jgi:hypothetical protein